MHGKTESGVMKGEVKDKPDTRFTVLSTILTDRASVRSSLVLLLHPCRDLFKITTVENSVLFYYHRSTPM